MRRRLGEFELIEACGDVLNLGCEIRCVRGGESCGAEVSESPSLGVGKRMLEVAKDTAVARGKCGDNAS